VLRFSIMTEQHLLDAIDDATLSLRSYRRICRFGAVCLITCVALIVFGCYLGAWGRINHTNTNAWAVILIVCGVLGFVITLVLAVALLTAVKGDNHPELALRQAQRAYRDHLMQQQLPRSDMT
jgi:uncharacterized membrane protein